MVSGDETVPSQHRSIAREGVDHAHRAVFDFALGTQKRCAEVIWPRVEARSRRSVSLIAWFVIGVGVLLLVPLARGDRLLGATLPFWLVVAPLVDLGWIERRRIARRVTQGLRSAGEQASRDPQRACSARAARSGVQRGEIVELVVAVLDEAHVGHRAQLLRCGRESSARADA